MLFKLGAQRGEDWVRHEYGNYFSRESASGPDRLRIAAKTAHTDLLLELARGLTPPFYLLFVLHTARLGRDGRFESPDISLDQLELFLAEFGAFLENDARHDFWIASESAGLLVYDRHNLIYAYGPLEGFEKALRDRGMTPGDPLIPSPHFHNYHAAFDTEEDRLLGYFDWRRTPLRPEDEQ